MTSQPGLYCHFTISCKVLTEKTAHFPDAQVMGVFTPAFRIC
jgi:hypothetical protein